jgi:hypothetical protein
MASGKKKRNGSINSKSRSRGKIEGMKTGWKSEVELSMLHLQQKEQLLLAQKRLLDAGVSITEVNSGLSIHL